MEQQKKIRETGTIHAENIGGIEETTVEFSPGVTVLEGRNATNRTSFLQAVMAALGSENVSIKGDADEASVELTLGDETYTRTLSRRSGTIVSDGKPYLDDPMLADLFAFLLESNEARRAVAASDDLRELIMRPVDTDAIHSEIDRLVEKRRDLERELDEIDDLKGELPGLEEKRTQLTQEIEAKKAELAEKEAELQDADADVEETREEKSALEDKLDELRSKRKQLDDIRYDLETERESLEALNREQQELEDEKAEHPETPVGEISEIESEISRLREQKQTLEAEVSELQSVIGFNEDMLEDADTSALETLSEGSTEDITEQLLPSDDVTCWTCGSEVEKQQIESTIDQLRQISRAKFDDVNELDDEIDDLNEKKRSFQQAQRERDRIERRLSDLEREIERSENTIDELQTRREEVTDEIETIEAEVEELENEDYSAILDLHKEANQIEYELGKLENDLERVEGRIEEIEGRIAQAEDIETRHDEVSAEIEDLRTKIEQIEQNAVEEFNEHMDTVLEMLGYANLDRIWIERVERDVREGRRKVTKSVFQLHVIRTSTSGAAYEDTIDHLSESEREVTGLVFALAGYLAHEVYEDIPFMLLDSLEAIDSERIATLVDYLTDYTGYLLAALLPEDAAALSDEYERVTEI
ncbi:archaea-specific SMC-related protein [Natrinema hispanicum]|uniref:AAA domain-containing protein n=1 Tax=Natrinema hispanicum TaxID=392421 RepID=A0A1I0IEP2_9EURY|nr:archaea-specific SMC-related protein [Natrinema hispanicum]SET94458.1 AAA domain-containing protein [Natrinema hispanicum]